MIAYAIPGVDEVVQHGVTGYLVPKNNIQAIVKVIRELASTYATLVTSTHAYIATYPTWSQNGDTFASVLFS